MGEVCRLSLGFAERGLRGDRLSCVRRLWDMLCEERGVAGEREEGTSRVRLRVGVLGGGIEVVAWDGEGFVVVFWEESSP